MADSATELPYVKDITGIKRYLAKLPATDYGNRPKLGAVLKAQGLIDPRDWKTISRKKLFSGPNYLLNQATHNSCTGNGVAGGLARTRVLVGQKFVKLSPAYIYSLVNGNRDQGAVIGDAVKKLHEVGTCEFSIVGQDPVFRNQMPKAAAENARLYLLGESYHCPGWLEVGTAIQLGFIVVIGICVGSRFNTLDRNGVAGFTNGYPNHCMLVDGCTILDDGTPTLDCANSWDLSFGIDGRCQLVEQHFSHFEGDHFAMRSSSHSQPLFSTAGAISA